MTRRQSVHLQSQLAGGAVGGATRRGGAHARQVGVAPFGADEDGEVRRAVSARLYAQRRRRKGEGAACERRGRDCCCESTRAPMAAEVAAMVRRVQGAAAERKLLGGEGLLGLEVAVELWLARAGDRLLGVEAVGEHLDLVVHAQALRCAEGESTRASAHA